MFLNWFLRCLKVELVSGGRLGRRRCRVVPGSQDGSFRARLGFSWNEEASGCHRAGPKASGNSNQWWRSQLCLWQSLLYGLNQPLYCILKVWSKNWSCFFFSVLVLMWMAFTFSFTSCTLNRIYLYVMRWKQLIIWSPEVGVDSLHVLCKDSWPRAEHVINV